MRKAFALLMTAAIALAIPAAAASGDDTGKDTKDRKAAVHKITQSVSYLMVDPIYTTILDGSRPQGLLMVGIGLDVANPALRSRVDKEMPILRDAYVRNLMAFTATAVRSWHQPDVTLIAERLQGVTDRVLQKKGAHVLLAQVAMRLNN